MAGKYAVLKPLAPGEGKRPTREQIELYTVNDIPFVPVGDARLVAIDFETRGTATYLPETEAVGVAVSIRYRGDAVPDRHLYVSADGDPDTVIRWLIGVIRDVPADVPILAHNALFDEAILRMHLERMGEPRLPPSGYTWITHCSYLNYRAFANEGWVGQRHGLKDAMREVLGWGETNERDRDTWLVGHGYHSGGPTYESSLEMWERDTELWEEGIADADGAHRDVHEFHLDRCSQWVAVNPDKRKVSPRLGEMWRVPSRILGPYAARDAAAAIELWDRILTPARVRFPEAADFLDREYMHLISLLIEQTHRGMRVDRTSLERHRDRLLADIAKGTAEARVHPDISPYIREVEGALLAKHKATEPERYVKEKLRTEPPRYNKNGKESKSWLSWRSWRDSYEGPRESKNWLKWKERHDAIKRGEDKDYLFSFTSELDMRKLIYGDDFTWKGLVTWSWGEEPVPEKGRPGTVKVTGKNGTVELDRTESGHLPVDSDALSQVDSTVVPIIQGVLDKGKELSYVESYLEAIVFCPSSGSVTSGMRDPTEGGLPKGNLPTEKGTWRLHAGWRAWGTWTGRLAGSDPNLAQIPKSLELLDCFVPDEGTTWIESDIAAAEPHALAEMSRDPGLMALYGPNANPNHDRYLYDAAGYPGEMGDRVRALYDRADPKGDQVALAKKVCKDIRQMAKPITLGMDYGSGVRKMFRTLQSQGHKVTYEQVTALHAAQRQTYAGIYEKFIPSLEREWDRLGGFVVGCYGFPICVDQSKRKDLCNRITQHGAHLWHVSCISIFKDLCDREGIEVHGIVWDFHDQAIVQVNLASASRSVELFNVAALRANEKWGGVVPLKVGPRIVNSLSEAKLEEAWVARESQRNKGDMI